MTTPENSPTDLQVRTVMWCAATKSAEELGLTRKFRMDTLWDGQLVIIATPSGMNTGRVLITHKKTGTVSSEYCHLNGQLLYERTYDSAGEGWGGETKLISHLPQEVAIFVENTLD